jgi:hypothetical protein
MAKTLLMASACIVALTTPVLAADTSSPQPQDACLIVATAKNAQWQTQRLKIDETRTLADGSTNSVEAIFTDNNAYGRFVGKPWVTMNLVHNERLAPPPEKLVKNMGLVDCERVGASPDFKEPVSIYTFAYLPDSHVQHATGKIWISDADNLPLRQELEQDEVSWPHNVPIAVSLHFTYGDDVKVPKDANRADIFRRQLSNYFLGGF